MVPLRGEGEAGFSAGDKLGEGDWGQSLKALVRNQSPRASEVEGNLVLN